MTQSSVRSCVLVVLSEGGGVCLVSIAERVRVELQGRGDVHVLRCYHQKHHSDPKGSDRLTETQTHVDDLKGIMVRNIGETLSSVIIDASGDF